MTNVEAVHMLQGAVNYLVVTTELTSATKAAEDLIGDCIIALWNDPTTSRREYWGDSMVPWRNKSLTGWLNA